MSDQNGIPYLLDTSPFIKMKLEELKLHPVGDSFEDEYYALIDRPISTVNADDGLLAFSVDVLRFIQTECQRPTLEQWLGLLDFTVSGIVDAAKPAEAQRRAIQEKLVDCQAGTYFIPSASAPVAVPDVPERTKYVPSTSEIKILDNLKCAAADGKGMTTEKLAKKIELSQEQTGRLLRNLKDQGRVANKAGLGWYRTDTPPSST